jgi:RND family efflux transporter MFP subunit
MKKIKIIITILMMPWLLTACKEAEKPALEKVKPAKTMTVKAPKKYIERQFSGKVIAAQKATLSFEIAGKLVQFPTYDGMMVSKADLIAAIDPKHYKEKLNEAKASYSLANAQFERAEKLIKEHYISQSDYDLLKSKKEIAKANLSSAEKNLKDTVIYAPFDGVIVKSFVENYEYVKAKQPVVLLQDLHEVDLETFVPEYIILQLKDSKKLNPKVIFSLVNRSYPVKLKEFSTEADKSTQTYRVVFTLKAPEDINILPGMSVKIALTLPDYKVGGAQYFLIPASAVFSQSEDTSAVWIVDPNTNEVQARQIETGDLVNASIKVFKGLKAGETIVSAGVHHLHEGQKIKPLDSGN